MFSMKDEPSAAAHACGNEELELLFREIDLDVYKQNTYLYHVQ